MRAIIFLLIALFLLGTLLGCTGATPTPGEGGQTGASATPYSVSVTSADFVEGVTNPYFPLSPGTRWVYEATLEDGSTERIVLEILAETRVVNGVSATVLYDTVFVEGMLVEETWDWFAHDQEGNVWYLGEEVNNFEDGVLKDHAGSWEWGIDGALPGVIMWADPSAHLGESYYQEYYPGEAEDMGQVLSVGENVAVPQASYENVLQTYDYSSLDPDLQEHKFYAPGVGMIQEIDLTTGEEVLLVEFEPAD
jgi:hypothetical protein